MGIVSVYRLEHRDTGVGPYTDRGPIPYNSHAARVLDSHNYGPKCYYTHPSDRRDGAWPTLAERWGMSTSQDYAKRRCAFAHPRQLLEWFDGARAGLHRMGFRVVEYRVPEGSVGRGERQVCFLYAHATRVRTLTVRQLAREVKQ